MNENERLGELVELCRAVYNKGMVCGSGGNASFRHDQHIFITPTGYSLGRIRSEDIVKVSLEGEAQGKLKPSKELSLHLAAYRTRPDIQAVLHVHSFYTLLVGIMAENGISPMPPYSPGYVMKIGTPAIVPFNIPGSPQLAQSIEDALDSNDVVLMKNHGVTIVGPELQNLLDMAEEVENNARLHVELKGRGALNSKVVAQIKERYR